MKVLKNDSQTATYIKSMFKFNDKVKILPLDVEGRVLSFWFKPDGLSIEVRYYLNNECKQDYFYEDELEVIKPTGIGFVYE